MKDLIEHLLNAPDEQIDAKMKPLIQKWSDPPTPLQILEVIDHCIHGSLASGVIVMGLQIIYENRLKAENTTHEEVVKLATWRHEEDR